MCFSIVMIVNRLLAILKPTQEWTFRLNTMLLTGGDILTKVGKSVKGLCGHIGDSVDNRELSKKPPFFGGFLLCFLRSTFKFSHNYFFSFHPCEEFFCNCNRDSFQVSIEFIISL